MLYRRLAGYLLVGMFLLGAAPLTRADDDTKAKIAAAGDAAKYNADAVVVLDETDVTVRPSGIGTARSHVVTKILKDCAIRAQSVQVFQFDPNTNRLELDAVRVYRADGRVEELPLEGKIEQPQPAWGIFWGTQQYLVSVPRLAVGDAVETITEMTGFNVAYLDTDGLEELGGTGVPPVEGTGKMPVPPGDQGTGETPTPPGATSPGATPAGEGEELNARGQVLKPPVPGNWHDEVHFWSSVPIIEKRYTVRVPKDKPLQSEVYNGELRTSELLDGDQIVYTFEKKDITPVKSEPAMEPWPNVGTKLLLATLPTWQDKSRWLYEVSEPQFQADDAIRAKVAEVTKDCKTDEEKYTALNHWVAENIRYAGTSRGMCEGYTIHACRETFRDRCGVCKDKAGMLAGMLRVAGFDAYVCMTMARQRVDRIPADQFNHCVTCIRGKGGKLTLLDPTWMPKSRDNWSTFEPLQHVVYGLPEGKGLSQSPDFPPDDNVATWQGESSVETDGGLTGKLTFTACGAPETRLRRALAGRPVDERADLFDASFQRLSPNVRVSGLTCTDPLDFSGPIKLQCHFEAGHYVVGSGALRLLALPMLQTVLGDRTLADLFGNTASTERKYGLRLWATRKARFEETVKLPAGWEVSQLPDAVDMDGPSAALQFKIESQPGQLHYTCELVVKRWIIPPAEYANYKEVIDKFEELAGRVVACSGAPEQSIVEARDAGVGTRDPDPGPRTPSPADAVIELWDQHWTQNADGSTVYHETQHVRLNSERAYHDFADPRITFNASTDRLEVLAARVKLPDGTYRELPDYAKIEVAPNASAGWPAFANIRQRLLVMSGIEPGCVVELEYKITTGGRDSTSPYPARPYVAADLRVDHHYPIEKRTITVDAPAGVEVRWATSNLPTTAVQSGTNRWTFTDLPAAADEPQSPLWQTCHPRVAFSTAGLASRWLASATARLEAAADQSELISKLAGEWTKDQEDPSDKLRALQEKLASSFNFVEFPVAWRPAAVRPASQVLECNYGLPAEAAAALLALARAAGLPVLPGILVNDAVWNKDVPQDGLVAAYVVLLVDKRAGDQLPRGAGQGDSPYAALDSGRPPEIWDPHLGRILHEGRWAGYTLLPVPDVLLPRTLIEPWASPDESRCQLRGKLTLADDGNVSGNVTLRTSGLFATSESLRSTDAQRSRASTLLGRVVPDLKVESVVVKTLAAGEFEVSAQVKSSKPLKKARERYSLRLAEDGPFLADVPLPLAVSRRETGVHVPGPFDEDIDLTLEWPEKWRLEIRPGEVKGATGEWGAVEQTASVDQQRLVVHRHTRITHGELSPADFQMLRAALNELRSEYARTLVLKP
jgi:transglutaminase-like putative cysteine protease